MPDHSTSYLHDMRPAQQGVVHSVSDDDPGFLRFLEVQGLVPGAEFSVVDFSPYDNNLRLQVKGKDKEIVLGASATAQVQVEIKNAD